MAGIICRAGFSPPIFCSPVFAVGRFGVPTRAGEIPVVLLGSFFVLGEGWFPRRSTGLSLSLSLSWPLCSGAAGVAAGEGSGAFAAGVSAGGETGGVGFGGSDPPDPGRRNTGGLSWSSSRGADGSEGLFFGGAAPTGSHFPSATHALPL